VPFAKLKHTTLSDLKVTSSAILCFHQTPVLKNVAFRSDEEDDVLQTEEEWKLVRE
jgi:hypothetical protein